MIGALLAGTLLLASPPAHEVDAIDRTKTEAYADGKFVFCTDPEHPLGQRQLTTCSMAHEIEGCEALVKACDEEQAPKAPDWLARLAMWVGPFASVFLYLLVFVILIAIAVPVVAALLQLRRRKKLARAATPEPNVATLMSPTAPEIADDLDPEEALRRAEEQLARGDRRGAIAFSLAAALRALDRRGAIRIGRHRTNGEYVRACAEELARRPLRDIVRTVDAMEFGGVDPTAEHAHGAAERAKTIVRAAAVVAVLGVLLLGCNPPKKGADPAGDELPVAILKRNGYEPKPLSTSLSTMPVPEKDEGAPVVLLDAERVPLEAEAAAHLMRWVEAGGVLVLFGKPDSWPPELVPSYVEPATRDLEVSAPDPPPRRERGLLDMDSEEPVANVGEPIVFSGARVSRRDAFAWKDAHSDTLATLGGKVYAARRQVGLGFVLGVANDDLWTNVGVMRKHNAAALVTLVRAVSHEPRRQVSIVDGKPQIGDIRIARPEDGVPPPSNPFAALVAAGLGKGAWHALAAAILLFLAYGIRHARARSVPAKTRRAFVEHVEATGAFYARARARSHALAAYGRFLELRLREIAPRGADAATFLAARSGADAAHVTKLVSRALAAKTDDLPQGDELQIIAELRTLLAAALSPSST